MLAFTISDGEFVRVKDSICWRSLEGRTCLSAADNRLVSSIDVIIIPIITRRDADLVMQALDTLNQSIAGSHLRFHMDNDGRKTAGQKFNAWENLGVPIRMEIGPEEASNSEVSIVAHPFHSKHLDTESLQLRGFLSKSGGLVICKVPFASAHSICERIMNQIRSADIQGGDHQPCSKLHIKAEEEMICIPHLRHLIFSEASKPCHCHQGHISLSELKARISKGSQHGDISWFRLGEKGKPLPTNEEEEEAKNGPCTLLVSGEIDKKDLKALFRDFNLIRVACDRGLARVTLESVDAARRAVEALDGLDGLSVSFQLGRRDKLFPFLTFSERIKMRVGAVASYSMTDQSTANEMTEILATIASALWQVDPNASNLLPLTVTDATACSGGNTISLLSRFQRVNAVELDPDIFSDLTHNLFSVLKISSNRLSVQNCDYLDLALKTLNHIVFLDPPWNEKKGPGYGCSQSIAIGLKLGSMTITDICARLLLPYWQNQSLEESESLTRLIALKLPTRGTDPQAFYDTIVVSLDALKHESVDHAAIKHNLSGASFRFGRSLLLLIAVGLSMEEMQRLMKHKKENMKLNYQLLK